MASSIPARTASVGPHLSAVDRRTSLRRPGSAWALPPSVDASALTEVGLGLREGEVSLSASALLTLADVRLGDLDAQIGDIMLGLQDRGHAVDSLTRQQMGLEAIRSAMMAAGSTDPDDLQPATLLVQWDGQTVRAEDLLEGLDLEDDLPLSGGDQLRLGAIDALVDQLKIETDRANSSNELDMIRLQSLMSQRTQVVELATRMLRALADAQEGILRNLGA